MTAYRIGCCNAMYDDGIWHKKELRIASRCESKRFQITHFNVLPNIRLWIDDAHVRLVRSAVHEHSVIKLQEGVLCVVLCERVSLGYGCSPSIECD